MSNPNDLVIIRRGDVEALKQEAIFGVFRRDAVEWDKLNALLSNAPVVSGEFGISFMKYTEFGVVPDDYKNQAGGYRAGWNDCIASVKYTITTPQKPQEQDELVKKAVADALEEAAKLCRKKAEDYASLAISSNEVKDFSSDSICTHKKSVALVLEDKIRAIIKRNAEEGE